MIAHVDLDAFYASVEQRDRPALRGRPVLVAGSSRRGVVLAASYESRRFGCKSAMPTAQALRLCKDAVVVPPRMDAYVKASGEVRAILDAFSPLVEPISIDEAFVDLAGTERLLGPPEAAARAMKRRIKDELGLDASVGVAAVKMVAKIATDLGKPDGLVVVPPDQTRAFLAPLPVERLFGVGKKTAEILRGLGLLTLGQVARHPEAALVARLGRDRARALQALARGEDARVVVPDREAGSIGAEETFERDLSDGPALRRHLRALADRVAARLRAGAEVARVIVLKLKDPQFHVTTRRRTLDAATADGRVIAKVALELLDLAQVRPPGVRLAGVSAASLAPADGAHQLMLDEPQRQRGERLGQTIDRIRDRFGTSAVARAEALEEDDD